MITTPKKKIISNKVVNRFLPIPLTVLKGLEPEPKITDFTLIKDLGEGTFGRVLLVQHNGTQAQYAIKAIDKRIKDNIEEKPYFRREMEIMYKINHPNAVKLFGHFEDNTYCYFVMEYIPRGNLYSYIPENGIKKISDQTVASLIKDVISALYYLHNMNPPIIHRDIKPENILIDEQMRAKLSDFGWSNYLRGNFKRTTICGTPIYLAPEIITNIGHDEKIDIWCVGVLMFELLTGMPPWKGDDVNTVKNNISQLRINWPKNMDKDARDLISKILRYMPEERPSLRTILEHRFFTKYYPDAVNCLQVPSSEGRKLFLISKDHPLTFDWGLSNNLYNESISTSTDTFSYSNLSSINQYNVDSFPKTEYNQTKSTMYSVSPSNNYNFSNNSLNQSISSAYNLPSISNELVEPNYTPTRNTFTYTPLNNSILPKNDYNYSNYSINNNIYPQTDYNNIIRTNGYSIMPTSTIKANELVENEDRINELVRKTVMGNYFDKNFKDNTYQNMYDHINSNIGTTINNQTQYRTLRPTYYSDTNLSSYTNYLNDNNNLYSTNENNKYLYNMDNNSNYNFGNYNTFSIVNDPEIIKWKEQEKLTRESERLKLSSLMNRYGMSLTPIYTNNKYDFL